MAADLTGYPKFETSKTKSGALVLLSVICPRCKGGFFVVPRRWHKAPEITRSCPYCFKVSLR